MSYYIVDRIERIAQQVSPDAVNPEDTRFVKVQADTVREAFSIAGIPNLSDCIKSLYNDEFFISTPK